MTRFLISSNKTNLAAALAETGGPTATVEAEYGDDVVPGTALTLAHHGPRSANPCPCLANNGLVDQGTLEKLTVGLSHLDLDTVGGCAALMGNKPFAPSFWELAAFVDIYGPHKLGQSGASAEDVRRLYAWWAWSEANRVEVPRDGSVKDVTTQVLEAIRTVGLVMTGAPWIMLRGDAFKAELEKLNAESLVDVIEAKCADGVKLVAMRVSAKFVNAMYALPDGRIAHAVVAMRTPTRSINVSFADVPTGTNARDIVQELWGPEAGGHAGIAGSPRGKAMTVRDLASAADLVRLTLQCDALGVK